jgi:hypothetical protein
MFHLGQDRSVKVQIEMETTRMGLAIGSGCHGDVHQTSDRHAAGARDAEQKSQLFLGPQAGHGNQDLRRRATS